MRIFALLLLAVSVPSFAGVCGSQYDEHPDGWYAHRVEYRPGPKLQPGETFRVSGWDRTFTMKAIPFTEFGHGKNESGEPKMWALHTPEGFGLNDSYLYSDNVYATVKVRHVKLDDCSDIAVKNGAQPRHDISVSEEREFISQSYEIEGYDADNGGWPSEGFSNSLYSDREVSVQLKFIQNETMLDVSVRLKSSASIRAIYDEETRKYIYPIVEQGSKFSELKEACYYTVPYSNFFNYPELDEDLTLPVGPIVIDSQCTFDDAPIYDYRAYLDPERHREYPTSLFYRLKQIIKYIYIEPLN